MNGNSRVDTVCISVYTCALSYQFVGVFGPGQVADLGAGVDALEWLSRECVPEADAAVSRSSSGRQQAVLVRRPRDGLDRR